MKKIVLCGSTRFKRAFDEWNARLTLEGNLVYSVALVSTGDSIPTEKKTVLDLVHQMKIAFSDEIFVLDIGGYTGESTKREIESARQLGKTIRYLNDEHPGWDESQCKYFPE